MDAHVNMIGLGVVNPGETGVVMGSSFVHLSLTDQEIFKDGIWGPYKDAIIPVSYTHLDVYKRQVLDSFTYDGKTTRLN